MSFSVNAIRFARWDGAAGVSQPATAAIVTTAHARRNVGRCFTDLFLGERLLASTQRGGSATRRSTTCRRRRAHSASTQPYGERRQKSNPRTIVLYAASQVHATIRLRSRNRDFARRDQLRRTQLSRRLRHRARRSRWTQNLRRDSVNQLRNRAYVSPWRFSVRAPVVAFTRRRKGKTF